MRRYIRKRKMRKALRDSLNKYQRAAIEATDRYGIESKQAGKAWREFNTKLRRVK